MIDGQRSSAPAEREAVLDIDEDRIDDAVLALLFLTLGQDGRAWKGFLWEVMGRLYDKGMIGNPGGKAESVVLTDAGMARSEQLFLEMFAKPSR